MKPSTLFAGALVAASQFIGASSQNIRGEQKPTEQPRPEALTIQGCWSSKGNMTESEVKATAVSSGSCNVWCLDEGYTVFSLSGSTCYCGFAMPPEDAKADDKKCKYECPGYPYEACGSLGNPAYFSVYNMGVDMSPPNYVEEEEEDEDEEEDEKTTTTSASPSQTSAADDSGDEPDTTDPATTSSADPSEDEPEEKESGPNVAGIVAGVVSGIVVVAGVCFGLWFYMRRKRNNEIEEEYRRNAAVNAFISGSKPPSSSGSISMTDSRLDPVMAHRRMSDGSIADNEDYSRKILRVTNA